MEVAEGSRIKLTCGLLDVCTTEIVYTEWFFNGSSIHSDGDKMIMQSDTRLGIFSLELRKVSRSDTGEYVYIYIYSKGILE
jgi:hypothetical protein